jgi:hypothetical protein
MPGAAQQHMLVSHSKMRRGSNFLLSGKVQAYLLQVAGLLL